MQNTLIEFALIIRPYFEAGHVFVRTPNEMFVGGGSFNKFQPQVFPTPSLHKPC